MHLDILIFAAIAVFLALRLKSVLGTRHGEERPQPNPFVLSTPQSIPAVVPPASPVEQRVSGIADPAVREGLEDIARADPRFRLDDFLSGARYAFETIVTAYNAGRQEELKPLLSPALYARFASGIAARTAAGQTSELRLHAVHPPEPTAAHLGGVMAYITVRIVADQTAATRDAKGAVIDGDPQAGVTVENIWTLTRDVRSDDPNWILIETRAGGA